MSHEERINKIRNFYYCFLISLRLMFRITPEINERERHKKIRNWLTTTQQRNVFDNIIVCETQWLLEEIEKISTDKLEFTVTCIYSEAKRLSDQYTSTNKTSTSIQG